MSVEAHKETLEFKAEVSQVLDLVIRSLYSNKEIFLRELVSNASDAAERLRFEALTDEGLYESDPNLRIRVEVDADAGTVTVSDNGIGMSRQEVAETIGSIASSGTRRFLERLSGDQTKDSQLIGQFGVGFYSAFIVANRVTLISRRAGLGPEHGVRWDSEGKGGYTLETVNKEQRGTDVILHIKDDEKEFLEPWRLRGIIGKFSDHIALPVEMRKEAMGEGEEKESAEKAPEYEQVNRGTAFWMRNKSDLTDKDYQEFYRHISHDFDEPLAWAHNRVEGTNEYTALLYLPKRAPWDLWDRDQKHGVKLYVRRVFIMDEADKLMPHYLRFVKGVVDSDDLPLNVSRELLQHNRKIDTIRQANTKRMLSLLEGLAKDEPDKYQAVWTEFGRVMKEGPAEDYANRERIAALLRFSTTAGEGEEQKAVKEHGDLLKRLQEALGEQVKEVRASTRLVDSPACLVVGEYDMSANLARVLKSVGQAAPTLKPVLEVNLEHPLVKRLEAEGDQARFADLGQLLFDQAQLAEGGQLDDPAAFVGRLNRLMLNMMLAGK
ncbi:MAG: molecular chaperone HtpG [Chromatiaceae bacterium]